YDEKTSRGRETMCLPGCMETVAHTISRRGLFRAAGTTAVAGAIAAFGPLAVHAAPVTFSKVVDLTHPLFPQFPTYFGKQQFQIQQIADFSKHGFNMNKWSLVEHTGTHIDAPFHFAAQGIDAATIPIDTLVAPLCVIDIAERAAKDPDTQVTPDDFSVWEK